MATATPVTQSKAQSYSDQHEPGLKDQLKAVLARCDYFEIQTSNKGQDRKSPMGSLSPNFSLHQPFNDYDKGVLSKSGYVFVKGTDSLGTPREGYIHSSQVKAFSEWFLQPQLSRPAFLANSANPKAPLSPHRKPNGVLRDPTTYTNKLTKTNLHNRAVGSLRPVSPPGEQTTVIKTNGKKPVPGTDVNKSRCQVPTKLFLK